MSYDEPYDWYNGFIHGLGVTDNVPDSLINEDLAYRWKDMPDKLFHKIIINYLKESNNDELWRYDRKTRKVILKE
jgi:hypothetical protein